MLGIVPALPTFSHIFITDAGGRHDYASLWKETEPQSSCRLGLREGAELGPTPSPHPALFSAFHCCAELKVSANIKKLVNKHVKEVCPLWGPERYPKPLA